MEQVVFALSKPVVHRGQDFFGRKAELRFKPRFRGTRNSWSWKASSALNDVHEIDPRIARTRSHRIELTNGQRRLSVYEHVGVLRFFPLIGDIEITGTNWSPYDGRAISLWNTVKTVCETKVMDIPLYSVTKPVWYEYEEYRGSRKAFTQIMPSTDGKLTLDITRSFPGIGTHQEIFHFPNSGLLEEICEARTLGNPSVLYYISRLLSAASRWPHHKSVLWPQEIEKNELIRLIVWHAALDTLGALSLLCQDGYFIGQVTSVCSGHEADTATVRQANQCLVRV